MIYLSAYGLNNLSFLKVESPSHNIGRVVGLVLTHTYSSTSEWRFLVPYIIITRYSRTVSNVRTPPGAKKSGFRRKMSEENYVKNCPKETVAVGVEAQELATQTTLHHTTGFLPDYQLDTTIDNSSYSRSEGNSTQVPQTQAEMLWLLHQELTQTAQGPSPLQQLPPEMLQPLLQQLLPLLQRSKSKFCVKENRTHTPMGAWAVEKVASEKTNQAKAKVKTISKQIEQVHRQNETDILLSRAIHLEQELGRKPTILGFFCHFNHIELGLMWDSLLFLYPSLGRKEWSSTICPDVKQMWVLA